MEQTEALLTRVELNDDSPPASQAETTDFPRQVGQQQGASPAADASVPPGQERGCSAADQDTPASACAPGHPQEPIAHATRTASTPSVPPTAAAPEHLPTLSLPSSPAVAVAVPPGQERACSAAHQGAPESQCAPAVPGHPQEPIGHATRTASTPSVPPTATAPGHLPTPSLSSPPPEHTIGAASQTLANAPAQRQEAATPRTCRVLFSVLNKPGIEPDYVGLLASATPEYMPWLAAFLREKAHVWLGAGIMPSLQWLSSLASDVREIAGGGASCRDGRCSRRRPPKDFDWSLASTVSYLFTTKSFDEHDGSGEFLSLCQLAASLLVCAGAVLTTDATNEQIVGALLEQISNPTAFANDLREGVQRLQRLPSARSTEGFAAVFRLWRRIANNCPAPDPVIQAAAQVLQWCQDEEELRGFLACLGGGLWRELVGFWKSHTYTAPEHNPAAKKAAKKAASQLEWLRSLRKKGRNNDDQSIRRSRDSSSGAPRRKRSK